MENVVTNRYFHQIFPLCEILQTHATLFLLDHIRNISRIYLAVLVIRVSFVLHLLHSTVVNTNNSFYLRWILFIFIVKLAERLPLLFIPEALLCEIKANNLEHNNEQKYKNRHRYESK